MTKLKLIVTSAFGLEAVVKRELEDLGFSGFTVADGKIEFEAELLEIPRLNLWLRAADRVVVKLAEFPATDFGVLFDQTKAVVWEDWLPLEAKITVVGKSVRSKLMSVRSCQSIVKKAIVERLKAKFRTDWLPETGVEYTIQVAVLKDVAQITLDTSGPGLNKRGYRMDSGEVPLRENLAAALVELSFWDPARVLVDPMCGSGTILIEAAMMARNMAPGLNRTFASEAWPALPKTAWDEARRVAREKAVPTGELRIFGSDIDPDRIRDAKANAKRAGVDRDIVFTCCDVKDLALEEEYGIAITNPPYGIKLGLPSELRPIYTALDNIFRSRKGWSVYVLTADKKFPDAFRRGRPDKVRKLFNGTIETNYYQFYGAPPSTRRKA